MFLTTMSPQSRNPFLRLSICIAGLCLLVTAVNLPCVSQTINDVNSSERRQGRELYREKKYSEASTVFKKATKQDKRDGESWYYLGLIYIQENDFKNATKAFETAVKLQPNPVMAQTGLAYAFLLRNKLKDALKQSKRAIDLDPNYADAHLVLGSANFRLGAREVALQEAERAIALNKSLANAYLLKSQTLIQARVTSYEDRTNQYQAAAAALETYLRLTPSSTENQRWHEQLEALNFHLTMRSQAKQEETGVFAGRDVTTKVRLTAKPEPEYTEAAKRNQVTGTVVLHSVFAADGTVKHIVVISGLPDGLTWQAVNAAKQIKFIPATLNGRPVPMFLQLEYNFNLY